MKKLKKEILAALSEMNFESVVEIQKINSDNTKTDIFLSSLNCEYPSVVKNISEITGLKIEDIKGINDNSPLLIKKGATTSEAKSIRKQLWNVGAIVEFDTYVILSNQKQQ